MLTIGFLCLAQSELPSFGELSVAEKTLVECSFDKEADAIVLIDEGHSNYNDEYNLITTFRKRLKILKQKGVRYADVSIYYYSRDDFEYISDIEAYTWNAGDDIKKITNSSIYRKKVNDRVSMVTFALPDVKPGSIIEYRYTSTMKSYAGLENWFFHKELPVLKSCYWLGVPPRLEFAYRIFKSEQFPIVVKNEKGSGLVYFEMSSLPGLRDEPYMDSEKDYLQRVEFQLSGYQAGGGTAKYMTNWDEVTRTLMGDRAFGLQLNKNFPNSDALMNTVNAIAAPYDKMEALYNYVQKNIAWNGYKGIYAVDGVKEAWEKRKGTSGQINLMLINLLKEAGLEVYPILVSERGHGKVHPEYPFLDQFNNVMAYVLIEGKPYVLDASGNYTPPFMMPFSVINTKGFVVNRKKGGIVELTENQKTEKNFTIIKATVDENGGIHGEANIQSSEYSRLNRLRAWHRDKEKFRENYFTTYQTGMTMDSLVMKNLDNDSMALEQAFHFTIPPAESGAYKLVNLNLFTGMKSNPFLADFRYSNIDYGCLQNHTVIQNIELPANLAIESQPKSIRMIMPDTSILFTRRITAENNKLFIQLSIQTKRSVFTADEYGYVRDFYKKMSEIMNEQLVLRRKD